MTFDSLIYPGIYSPSGLDILTILVSFLSFLFFSPLSRAPFGSVRLALCFLPFLFTSRPSLFAFPFGLIIPIFHLLDSLLSPSILPTPLPHGDTLSVYIDRSFHVCFSPGPPVGLTKPSLFLNEQVSIHTRPSPTIYLGAVDDSCAILISDLTLPDQPIIYASSAFTALTGYLPQEVLGRNCRFLQRRPRQPLAALPMAQQQSGRSQSGKVGVGGGGGGGSGGVKGSTKQNSSSISSSSVNGNGYDCGIDMPSVVHKMRRAVARNREVQVEVVNYKKTGEPFVNLLTIIPVWVPTAYGSSSTGSLGNGDCNLSVGFLCDLSTVGC